MNIMNIISNYMYGLNKLLILVRFNSSCSKGVRYIDSVENRLEFVEIIGKEDTTKKIINIGVENKQLNIASFADVLVNPISVWIDSLFCF